MSSPTMERQPWKHKDAADEFQARHNRAPFTMAFNTALEAQMIDKELSSEQRVLAAAMRFAWGNLSDFAVDALPARKPTDPTPRPLTQEVLASRINMHAGHLSEACKLLKTQGYLRNDTPFIWPEERDDDGKFATLRSRDENAKSFGVDSDSGNISSPYLRFKERYLTDNTTFSEEFNRKSAERDRKYAEAREAAADLREMERKILAAFRDAEREEKAKKGGPSNGAGNGHGSGASGPGFASASGANERRTSEPETGSDSAGVDSRLQAEKFPTPAEKVPDSAFEKGGVGSETPVTPNVSNTENGVLLKSFKSLNLKAPTSPSDGRQAGKVEEVPACLPCSPVSDPEQPPKLAGLRDLFPDEFMTSDALNALDDHFVAKLGADYERQWYVDFVKRRQEKGIRKSGKIRTGLVFERESGLPYDFCEWAKDAAEKNRAALEEEKRRQGEDAIYAEDLRAFEDYQTSAITKALDEMPAGQMERMVDAARKKLSGSQAERWARIPEAVRQADAEQQAWRDVKDSLGLMSFEDFRESRHPIEEDQAKGAEG